MTDGPPTIQYIIEAISKSEKYGDPSWSPTAQELVEILYSAESVRYRDKVLGDEIAERAKNIEQAATSYKRTKP